MPLARTKLLTSAIVAGTALAAAGAVPAAAQLPGPAPAYGLGGTVVLNGNAKGSADVGGLISDASFAPDGSFSGRLSWRTTTATPVVNGWLFANLRMNFDADAPVTGTVENGTFTATAKVTVRFPKVVYFGFLVGSGANCKTKEPATLTLKGASTSFDPRLGDRLTGTFAIGAITGCGPFTSTVQSLLSSPKHTFLGNIAPSYA